MHEIIEVNYPVFFAFLGQVFNYDTWEKLETFIGRWLGLVGRVLSMPPKSTN